jgi:hypothetical protein
MVKSTDGGASWSKPVAVSSLADIQPAKNTAFRVNSYPMADVAPNGNLYVNWSSETGNSVSSYAGSTACASNIVGATAVYNNCHAAALYSKSVDGGATWSAAALVDPALGASTQTPIGYPATSPDGSVLNAPVVPRRVDELFTSVAISPSGNVYMSTYVADVVSPWQTCAAGPPPPEGRINCTTLGNYIDNARLDYDVVDLTTGNRSIVTTQHINTRYGFGGGFFGDYTDIAVGSDNRFHALWTDSNNVQSVVWFYGFEFVPTPIHQEDVVTVSGSF